MYAYPKEYLSVADLIQKLENKGMIIDSYEGAETALTTIGYYQLKGYCYHLVNPITQNYEEGTTFSSVVKLHQFDSKLSHLLFYYLSQIEISLKSRLVYSFQVSQESPKDVFVLSDPSKFKDKLTFWKNQGTIVSEIYRSKDAFIQHNFQKYDGAIPI